jgi:hypothetical protein
LLLPGASGAGSWGTKAEWPHARKQGTLCRTLRFALSQRARHKEIPMRQIMFALAVIGGATAAASLIGTAPAQARDYPYCVQGQGVGIPGDCSYSSYEQCMASASGRLAYCDINPRFAFGARDSGRVYAPPPRGHHRRAY